MRSIQASLFPRFDTIEGMDLAAAYLPADMLSGNFIDGFPLDSENYQLAVCDVYESETQSSFIGTMARAIVRSYSSARVVPSALLEKLGSIAGGVSCKFSLNVFQLNQKSGRARVSSYGKVNTFFYVAKNQKSEFTEYAPVKQDLILIAMRRTL